MLVQLNIDGGDMLDTRADPLATSMTSSLTSGGLGKHTTDELDSILAGRQVSFNIGSDAETFQMGGRTTPRDLELQLQLMTAALTDAAYRPQGEANYRRNIANYFARANATPQSTMSVALGGILSDDDPRFSTQPEANYLALTFAGLKREISDRLAHGALELAIVGDVDPDTTIDLVARTLGALPMREADFRPYADNRDRRFTTDRTQRILHHDGPADQALLRMVWPTTDDHDLTTTLTLELLERVARLDLTETLREKLGETYSPQATASESRVYPGYGTFSLAAEIDTKDVDATRASMLETIRSLASAPVEDDMLLRARQPLLESYDNALKTAGGWMTLADRAQTEADRIERFTRGKQVLSSLTAADLQAAAAKYLLPDQRVEVVALPREMGGS